MLAGRPMLEWSPRRCCAAGIDAIVVALRRARAAPAGAIGVRGGATRSASVRAALRPRRRGDVVVVHDAARPLVTPELFARVLAALDGRRRAIAAAPVTDTIKEADADGARARDARPLAPVGGPDAAGVPARRRCERALDVADGGARRRDRRRVAGRARRRHGARRRDAPAQLQGHDAARPARRRALLLRLTDADRLPRPPAPGRADDTTGRALLHRRQRRALPRGRRGARDRGARAWPSTSTASPRRSTSGSTRSGAQNAHRRPRRLLRVRARGDRPAARHRGRLRPRPRGPDGEPARRRTTGTTSSARCTSCATTRSTWTTDYDIWAPRARRRAGLEALLRDARRGGAARGLYDIIAHPDLVKVWGAERPLPEGDLRRFYEPAVEAIAERGVAIEVSTAGLRKPVGEIYPAPRVPRDVRRRRLPVALSSDAHIPEQLGYGYEQARRAAGRPRRDRACRVRGPRAAPGADRMTRGATGIGFDSTASTRAAALMLGGVDDPARRGPRRPLRRRRAHPRDDRRAARRGRPRRHRPALPRHRRALARRGLARAAARGRRRCSRERGYGRATSTRRSCCEAPKLGPHREAIATRWPRRSAWSRRASTSRPRPARGWASSAAARASRRWRSRPCRTRRPRDRAVHPMTDPLRRVLVARGRDQRAGAPGSLTRVASPTGSPDRMSTPSGGGSSRTRAGQGDRATVGGEPGEVFVERRQEVRRRRAHHEQSRSSSCSSPARCSPPGCRPRQGDAPAAATEREPEGDSPRGRGARRAGTPGGRVGRCRHPIRAPGRAGARGADSRRSASAQDRQLAPRRPRRPRAGTAPQSRRARRRSSPRTEAGR